MSDEPKPPRIVSAAMLMDDGLVVAGARHLSPDMRATLRRIYGNGFRLMGRVLKKPYHLRVLCQGFIDSRGNFLTRTEAWQVAVKNDQIRQRVGGNSADGGTLYSENLY